MPVLDPFWGKRAGLMALLLGWSAWPLGGIAFATVLVGAVGVFVRFRNRPKLDGTVSIEVADEVVTEFLIAGVETVVPANHVGIQGRVVGVRVPAHTAATIRVTLQYGQRRCTTVIADGETVQVILLEKYSYPLTVSFTSRRSRIISMLAEREKGDNGSTL